MICGSEAAALDGACDLHELATPARQPPQRFHNSSDDGYSSPMLAHASSDLHVRAATGAAAALLASSSASTVGSHSLLTMKSFTKAKNQLSPRPLTL
jgi:hypothetical protein